MKKINKVIILIVLLLIGLRIAQPIKIVNRCKFCC